MSLVRGSWAGGMRSRRPNHGPQRSIFSACSFNSPREMGKDSALSRSRVPAARFGCTGGGAAPDVGAGVATARGAGDGAMLSPGETVTVPDQLVAAGGEERSGGEGAVARDAAPLTGKTLDSGAHS